MEVLDNQLLNKTILDSINEGVFTVNDAWEITYFNHAAERITGVPITEAMGQPCCDVFRASICENACALRETVKTGKPIVNVTTSIVDQNGERIPIRISTALLKDKSNRVIGGVETFQDLSQIEVLQKQLTARYTYDDIIGRSKAMTDLFQIFPQIAETSSAVLIEGRSGTGKELVARAIHNTSPRKHKPFVAINCGAIPDTLLESELFGYKAGAFTDAKKDKPGKFVLANGGTLFLDEIGDVSMAMQVRLLRALQDQFIEPLGSVKPEKVDVRIMAATNKELKKLVQRDKFREDLFYRICVIHLTLPPLKDRREDIPLLINHFISKHNHLQKKNIESVSPEVMECLLSYDYPGNIRELENILEQAFVLCRGTVIQLNHLRQEIQGDNKQEQDIKGKPRTLKNMERALIHEALQRHRGNRKQAAHELGIDTSTLYRKIKQLGILPPEQDGRTVRIT
jgi:PAS domain S-box-containing protein